MEEIKNKILEEYKKGNIVVAGIEGLQGMPIAEFIKQPVDGILYDLNRSEEVVLTFLPDPKWRNDIKSKSQGGDNHWTKKKKFSNGARNKMSNTKKEMYKDGYVSPVTKRIKQLNLDGSFIREWESATQVQKELGFNRKAIVQCLIKKSKKSNNFLWLYV